MVIRLQPRECLHVRAGAGRQCVQIIPALEAGHDAALRVPFCEFDDAVGDPGVVVDRQQELGQRIAAVRVEACGNEDELRREAIDLGEPVRFDGLPELRAPGTGRQRHVCDMTGFGGRPGIRVERVLVARTQQYPVILQKYFFGTVPVMHVEVQYCDTLNRPG
jgi:hypothetical protein